MPAMCSLETKRSSTRLGLLTLAGIALGGLLVAVGGCGSVGDIGMGASRSGVQPVRGTYGTSGYGSMSDADLQRRFAQLTKANEKTAKKDGAILKVLKALPDVPSDTVATPEKRVQAEVTTDVKTVLIQADRAGGQSTVSNFAGATGSARTYRTSRYAPNTYEEYDY